MSSDEVSTLPVGGLSQAAGLLPKGTFPTPPTLQLSEEDIRTELCRALLRIEQYRLCNSYLAGLRPDAAEQLVLAAAREVFLSASGMNDRAVKQVRSVAA